MSDVKSDHLPYRKTVSKGMSSEALKNVGTLEQIEGFH